MKRLSIVFLLFFATNAFAEAEVGTSSCTETCSWTDAAQWGSQTSCQASLVAFGMCGSGENPDCIGSNNNHVTNRIYCCNIPGSTTGTELQTLSSKFGQDIECPSGKVVTSICGSGENPDCNPTEKYWNQITCSKMSNITTTSSSIWIDSSTYGENLTCPNAAVLTGICGSGQNPDCTTAAGNKVFNRIKCTYYTL